MGALLGLVFYMLVTNSLLSHADSAVCSTPDTVLKFSQCLVDKIGESHFFTVEDRDSMIEVADVMAQTMRHELPGLRSSTKVLAIAFVASMADVVILEDPTRNILRKEIYTEALEECSISVTGYIDVEFTVEALHLMTALENSKTTNSGNVSTRLDSSYTEYEHFEPNIHISDDYFEPGIHMQGDYFEPAPDEIFDYHAVQPSPVNIAVNPFPENFNPSFGGPQSSSQFSGVPSISKLNANIQIPSQPKSYLNAPSRFNIPGTFQSGSSFGDASSSAIAQGNISPDLTSYSQPTSSEFGILNIPQMKESKVIAITPTDVPQFGKTSFQGQSVLKTNESLIQPANRYNTSPEQQESFPIIFPVPVLQENSERPGSFNTALENIIYSILSNSTDFREAFHFGINQEKAVNLARTITEQSFSDHEDIAREAISAVSDAISTTSLTTPIEYAHKIATSLASVLKHNNMSLFVDAERTASDFLSNLPDTKHLSQPMVPKIDRQSSFVTSFSAPWEPEEPPYDFETATNAPEDINGDVFSTTLRQYLRESPEISNAFCNSQFSANRMLITFSTVKASLSGYGDDISAVAASIASGNLAQLSEDQLCSEYSQIISQEIAEILDENGLLSNANPEQIFEKMKLYLRQMQNLKAQSQQPPMIFNNANNTSLENIDNTQTTPTIQPSFLSISNTITTEFKTFPLNVNQTVTDSITSTNGEFYTTSVADLSEATKQNEKYVEKIREKVFTNLPMNVPVSPVYNPVTESEAEVESSVKVLTTAIMSEIIDNDFTSPNSLIDSKTSISDYTYNTDNNSDYTTEDYEDVAVILLSGLDSALNSSKSQSNDDTEISTESATELSSLENDKFLRKQEEDSTSYELHTTANSNENNPVRIKSVIRPEYNQRNRRNRRRKTTVTPIGTTSPASHFQLDKNNDDISPQYTPTQPVNSNRNPESSSRSQTKDLPYEDSMYIPLRILSEETDDSIKYRNNPVKSRNSRRQFQSPLYKDEYYVSDPPFTRKVLSIRDEHSDKFYPDKSHEKASSTTSGPTYKIQGKTVSSGDPFPADSSIEHPPVLLQPSFKHPPSTDSLQSEKTNTKSNSSPPSSLNDTRNSQLILAKSLSRISTASIDYIKSETFNFYELCARLNELAGILNIPPLDYYNEIALIDYLLYVLRSVADVMKNA